MNQQTEPTLGGLSLYLSDAEYGQVTAAAVSLNISVELFARQQLVKSASRLQFFLGKQQHKALEAMLDRPARVLPGLVTLSQRPSPFSEAT